ncbi:Nn.00g049140.m01.CDS01 [Neocucurbitaria sp. VM-36]
MIDCSVDIALGIAHHEEAGPSLDQAEPFYPKAFFDTSPTRQALPFSCKSLRKADYEAYLGALKAAQPANSGDLIWLIHIFLSDFFPTGTFDDKDRGSE